MSDTQDTFFESSESESQISKYPESQDFHLHDTEDSQELEANNEESTPVYKITVNENKQETIENDSISDEVDEVVHGTPPQVHSPSKKLAAIADLKSLKRKADMIDDSVNNDLQMKKTKANDPQDTLQSELEAMEGDTTEDKDKDKIDQIEESVVIPETQESQPIYENSEKNSDLRMENSLEEECDLVNEAIESADIADENQNDSNVANFADNDTSNQDDATMNESNLNESKEISLCVSYTENEEKNISIEPSKDTENETVTDIEKEIESTTVDNLENSKERAENEENIQETKLVDDSSKTSSIEDALKELGGESDTTESLKQQVVEKESTESELLAVLTDSDTNADVDEVVASKETPCEMETDELPELQTKVQKEQITKSRMSIEVIYDRSSLSQAKSAEIVEIHDLDSSQEEGKVPAETKNDLVCKSSKKIECTLTNGDDVKKEDLDTTTSVRSSESLDGDLKEKVEKETLNTKSETGNANPLLFIISDSEGDSMVENKSTSESHVITPAVKTQQIEKEFVVCVRLKCLVTIDENTKEILSKEVLGVNCETTPDQLRSSDTSTSLADISGNDNKDGSPGSVTSATYPRFSIMSTSTISSSTSSSSAGSLPAKGSDKLFSIPKGPAKHTKIRHLELDQLSKEWKNPHLVATSVLSFLNTELNGADLQNGVVDSIEDPLRKMRSSTPESGKETPQRGLKKGRGGKRLHARVTRKRSKVVSMKTSPNVIKQDTEDSDNEGTSAKKMKPTTSGLSTPVKKSLEGLRNATYSMEVLDELLGKEVFARWSDNNYYAGKVADKIKGKYKVHFHDGKSKLLISEFIIPITNSFTKGLSVYTLTKTGDYGPCGMIVDILNNDKISYVIEPDEGKRITVQIKDIFLTPDQAQVLKEEAWTDQKSLPSTPQSMSKVTLDNMIDGKRRSKRNNTTSSTPKSKKSLSNLMDKTSEDEPSVSGLTVKSKESSIDKKRKTSDSNNSDIEEIGIHGVQKEISGFANDQVATKGPQNRIKGKQRNRKKIDDQETIDLLGPIPESNSKIFDGMSFILTCAALEGIDRYHTDTGTDSNSEVGTDNEAEWQSRPFVRERLEMQLTAGGGKVYENFDLIPPSEYENTKLITNVPNLTAKSLLCLSVGISAYNHMWVIRSCQNNKPVNPSEEKLPAGWSIDRRTYVEMFHRRDQKPLTHIIVVIPSKEECDKEFVSFWSRICENAGGTVKVVDNPEISFIEGTVVLTNHRCPLWVIEKAKGWEIPLVSTTWVVQSLIEGKILTYDGHHRFMPF